MSRTIDGSSTDDVGESLIFNGIDVVTDKEKLQVEGKELLLNHILQPSNENANEGGIRLVGSDNKRIYYSAADDTWNMNKRVKLLGGAHANNAVISGVAAGVEAGDAINKAQLDQAATSIVGSLGTISQQNFDNVAITGGSIAGVDITIASQLQQITLYHSATKVATSYATLQSALSAIPAATNSAEIRETYIVYVPPGTYNEDLTFTISNRHVMLVALGPVNIGEFNSSSWQPSGNPRNVSITIDANNITSVRHTFVMCSLPENGQGATSHQAYMSKWRISGNFEVIDAPVVNPGHTGSTLDLLFSGVDLAGAFISASDKCNANTHLQFSRIRGEMTGPRIRLSANNVRFDGNISIAGYNLFSSCDVRSAAVSFAGGALNDLQPCLITNSRFTGAVTTTTFVCDNTTWSLSPNVTASSVIVDSNKLATNEITSVGTALTVGSNSQTQTVNIACGEHIQSVNIGSGSSTGVTTINIGGAGDVVNVAGALNTIQTTNLEVTDKNILLNKGAAGTGTARGAGISIRDSNNDSAGFLSVDGVAGTSFRLKAPESAFTLSTPVLTSDDALIVGSDARLSNSRQCNNLFDNAETARNNLGLGTVATENTVPVAKGGTGATTASAARTNLELGSVATENTVPIAKGGTGASTASAARTNLELGSLALQNQSSINGPVGLVSASGNKLVISGENGDFFDIEAHNSDNTVKKPVILNQNGGDVGIGMIPTSKLEVNGNSKFHGILQLGPAGGEGGELNIVKQNGTGFFTVDTLGTDSASTRLRIFEESRASGADIVLMSNSGNVGIGVSIPTYKLDVGGHTRTTQLSSNNGTSAGGNLHYSLLNSSNILRFGLGLYESEAGANSGSNLGIFTYSDAGGFIDRPMSIRRSDGKVFLEKPPYLAAAPTDAFDVPNKQYVDSLLTPNYVEKTGNQYFGTPSWNGSQYVWTFGGVSAQFLYFAQTIGNVKRLWGRVSYNPNQGLYFRLAFAEAEFGGDPFYWNITQSLSSNPGPASPGTYEFVNNNLYDLREIAPIDTEFRSHWYTTFMADQAHNKPIFMNFHAVGQAP